jgi:sialate O-acetylesterase
MIALVTLLALADVKLPALFGDHMVLQRESTVHFFGWAEPGEHVEVRPSWSGAKAAATETGANGRWNVELGTPAAGGPFEIVVAGRGRSIELVEVHVGEVWLASGQSNMEWTLGPGVGPGVEGWHEAVAAAEDPELCFFSIENTAAWAPAADVRASWKPSTPDDARALSATAYFFARELRETLGVPVGVVSADWGGTPAEAWTSPAGLADFPEFAGALAEAPARAAGPAGEIDPGTPSVLWNGMIAPLLPLTVRGVIWYQGEANRERAEQYRTLFPALICDWRRHFADEALPFYFVQIAPYGYAGDTGQAARLRDAQREALSLPHTGMAVTMDIGNPSDIHPTKKREVGERLALWALARTYGRTDLECSGPLYRSMKVEGSAVRMAFDHTAGLTSRDAEVRCLTIAGADRVFHPAQGRVEGETLVVSSPEVPSPVAVRFGWGAADETNLWNGAGLPASSFRTDDWPE